MPSLRLIVFDCDGTLVDSQHGIVAAAAAAWGAHGLAAPEAAAVRQVVGLNLDEALALLAPAADPSLLARLVESYRQAFFDLRQRPDHHEPLFPGIAELLQALDRPEILLGIATGKNMRGLTRRWSGTRSAIASSRCRPPTPAAASRIPRW
jgi:phosphoglycolate phosphatase